MNYENLIKPLAALKHQGNIRAAILLKKVYKHREQLIKVSRRKATLLSQIDAATIFLDTIDTGKIVASIDVEKENDSIRQIGITYFQEDGCRTLASINVNIKGFRPGTVFNHGKIVEMSTMEARRWLPQALSNVSCLVGHHVSNDFTWLSQNKYVFPCIPYFDTLKWYSAFSKQMLLVEYSPSLTKLCALLGVEFRNAHNAGNDARATMLCALKSRRLIKEWLDNKDA